MFSDPIAFAPASLRAALQPGSSPAAPPRLSDEEDDEADDEESPDGELDESLADEADDDLSELAALVVLSPRASGDFPPVLPDEEQPPSRMTVEARATPTRVRTARVVDMVLPPLLINVRAKSVRHATASRRGPLPGFGTCHLKSR